MKWKLVQMYLLLLCQEIELIKHLVTSLQCPYLQLEISNIRGTIQMEVTDIDESMKSHANKLGNMLHSQLEKHIRNKI